MKAQQKTGFIILLATALLFAAPATSVVAADLRQSVSRVAIDPGHGGKDPGAAAGNLVEKEINLSVALRLGALINRYYPDVEVFYTRKTDIFVPLDERGKIANRAGADLFISIHTNSLAGKNPSGVETYVMGVDKSESSLKVAMRENDVIAFENDYTTKYQGYQVGSAESFIIFSLMQYSYLNQSLALAGMLQTAYSKNLSIPNRGVKQAGFLVLWSAAMPSILTELGFIGNPDDQKLLGSEQGHNKYAQALFNAFSAYKARVEAQGRLIVINSRGEAENIAVDQPQSQQPSSQQTVDLTPSAPYVAPSAQPVATAPSGSAQHTAAPVAAPGPGQVLQVREPAPATARQPETAPARQPVVTTTAPARPAVTRDYVFSVQISASHSRLPATDHLIKPYASRLLIYKQDEYYRYYVGQFGTYAEALRLQFDIRRRIKDAFVVALRDGTRIPITEQMKQQ
ncbi:MAG: N-acetylmuramoyl-L-alanine amidase [Rikenellaceae bacterium]|jgi:N-acetylmuramoyl-L-alanine amidase|nr:N-acetylmuramoyl-L-alanine amidase [Rikenellaceae bacterium]